MKPTESTEGVSGPDELEVSDAERSPSPAPETRAPAPELDRAIDLGRDAASAGRSADAGRDSASAGRSPRSGPAPSTEALDLALLKGALEEIPFGVATTRGAEIVYANGAMERIYGVSSRGFERRPVETLFDRATYDWIAGTIEEKRVFDGRVKTRCADGRVIDAEVHVEWYSSESLGIGWFIVVRDVSLELSALGRLLDLLGGAMFRVRIEDGAMEYVSSAIQKLTGLDSSVCMEHPVLLTQLVSADERERLGFLYRRVLEGDLAIASAQVTIRRADGPMRTLQVRATGRRDTGGSVRHIEGVVTDVTQTQPTDAGYTPHFELRRQLSARPVISGAGGAGPISTGVMELCHELLRESSQHNHTIGRELRALAAAFKQHAPSLPPELKAELRARLEAAAAALNAAAALSRGVRKALGRGTLGAPLEEVLSSVRGTIAAVIGEPLLVIEANDAGGFLLEQRVDEITLAITYLALRAFRFAGSGELRIVARLIAAEDRRSRTRSSVELKDAKLELVGAAPADIEAPAMDISSDMLKTIPGRAEADVTFDAVKEMLGAVGVTIESDEAGLERTRTVLRIKGQMVAG